jgi:hypothetical protein
MADPLIQQCLYIIADLLGGDEPGSDINNCKLVDPFFVSETFYQRGILKLSADGHSTYIIR